MSEYVFKENPVGGLDFIGDFDGLYKENPDPWGQSNSLKPMAEYYDYSRAILAETVQKYVPILGRVLEVGCGLGFALDHISTAHEIIPTGVDISGVAIERARKRFPKREFIQADITAADLKLVGECVGEYDCVILNQILWYILHRLDFAVENCWDLLRPNGVLIISQAFLRGEQRYGKGIVDGFHGLLKKFSSEYNSMFMLLESKYDATTTLVHHDGILVFRRCEQSL